MNRIKLDAESLRVETFSTEALDPKLAAAAHAGATRNTCGDCSSFPHNCFCTEAATCFCQ